MSNKDYLGSLQVESGDKLDFGVKGMKWGVRRSSSQLRAAAAKRSSSTDTIAGRAELLRNKKTGNFHEINPDGTPGKVVATPKDVNKDGSINLKSAPVGMEIQNHVESSHDRYARLKSEAQAGRADKMTDQDLKFFNARTEALSKVSKMNKKKPGWLADTSKKVLQQTAQNSMQSIADGVAKKYISGPVIDAINKK